MGRSSVGMSIQREDVTVKTTLKAASIAATAFVLLAQPAFPRNLVWNFEGTFTSVPAEYAVLGLNTGDVLSGTLQVNSNAHDAFPNDPVRGQYDLIGKLTICVPALETCWTFSGSHDTHVMTILNDNPQTPPYDFLEVLRGTFGWTQQ